MVAVVAVDQLRKRYRSIEALRGLTLQVEKGQIFGLLGQNGAGKTTLIKILLGITRPTSGHAELLGFPAGSTHVRRRVGYLPEDHRFPEYHTATSLLDFYGALLGMNAAQRQKAIPPKLELVGLAKRKDFKIRSYSKGMKQRLGIAQALMHDPEIIFLDEPTDGVDPVGRREIRDLLQSLKNEGKTIFINSHLLGEVELVCDRVAILQRGEMIRQGTTGELTRQQGQYELALAPGETFPVEELARMGYDFKPCNRGWEIFLGNDRTIDPVVRHLVQSGLHLRHLVQKRQSLEDLFLATVDSAEPGVERLQAYTPNASAPVNA